jgi:phosphoribosylformimino-5-aminoimidazole carboxamide ribotide isomerase
MNVIPAIDLLDGKCVRLYQGDYAKSQTFNDNPVAVAREWVNEGATMLHLVDLDGAKAGHPVNQAAIEAIVRSVDVPCQVGGGMRDRASVAGILNLGVRRVILGTVAVEQPQLVGELCAEFPDQNSGRHRRQKW